MRNVNEIVRLTSMPIIAAASLSCAVARIALPCRVLDEPHEQDEHRHGHEHDEQPVPRVDDVADREHLPVGERLSTDTVSVPCQTMATFWRMNDMPMAVISGARRARCGGL